MTAGAAAGSSSGHVARGDFARFAVARIVMNGAA
jgi:hypothetical protein